MRIFFLTIENLYTSLVDTTSPIYCLAIVPATIIRFSSLGNAQQQDHLIVFDLEKLQMDEIHHCAYPSCEKAQNNDNSSYPYSCENFMTRKEFITIAIKQ